ncbi:hypothetical protein BDV95DRAFT_486699 [Massariosphaeria phaeospora]|uniref:Jacalin-type lectin domain-containing protein n=1 Tax=Massariosphaeria phaeospora TaxID=100035 RepID=A0A7C8MJU0_9PLEO|nr:hypothetical protein BDV95DRAFT_486699 [Massariosphaeria phaeospora]
MGFTGIANAIGACDNGPWQEVLVIGQHTEGTEYCETKWADGVVMTGIEVWGSEFGVLGAQFYYSDGSNSPQFGKGGGDKHAKLMWDPSVDSISQLKSWGNGRGQHLGRLQIRTKKGQELDVGKNTDGQDTFETKVASGIMLGAFGRSTDIIESMGFLFLKSTVDKITIDDIVFDETPEELNKRMQGIETIVLEYADHTNAHDAANETYTFGKTEQRATSKKFSSTATHTFGISRNVELSGKILDLGASVSTSLKYEYSSAKTEESTQERSVTLNYAATTSLKPGQRVFCRATAFMGTYDGKYSGNVNVWLADGYKYGFKVGGTMEQVNWSKASSKCQANEFDPLEDSRNRPENLNPKGKRAVEFIS